MDKAAKNVRDLEEAHEKEMNARVEDTEKIVAHNEQEVKTEVAKLNQRITHLEEERAQVSLERDQVKQQLTIALADKKTLSDESLAKTQQVKQYKKQVDNFRIQLAESNAKLEQYQVRLRQCKSDLVFCQKVLRSREEDEESKVAIVMAQHESEVSHLNSELGRLRREKADVEEQLRQLQKGVIPLETAHLVDNLEREKIEWEYKYLKDRYDGIFQHNDQLVAALKEHDIPIPPMPVLQMPGAMIPRSPHAPHVSRQNLMIKQKPAAREQGDNQIEENRCLSSEPQNKSEHREGRTTRLEREVKELRLNVQMVVAKQRDEEQQVKDKEPAVATLISQSDDSGENSVEYSTLIELTSELRLAISSELISLTGSLLAVRFISLDNEIELRNPAHSERERSARLVGLIQNKVRQNPRHYHTFISILQGNQDQYRDILQRLEHTYQKHKHNDGFTSA